MSEQPRFNKDQIIMSLRPFSKLIDELVPKYSRNQKMELFRLLGKTFLIGSKVLGDKKTWVNDNDLDLYLYEPEKETRDKNLKRLDNLIPPHIEQSAKLDLLPGLSTDQYKNSEGSSLTDYIFGVKKEVYTQGLGLMRALTLEGFFITKLATICDRDEKTDYMALKVVMDEFDNQLPEELEKTIKDFGLEKCMEKFRVYCL